MSVSKVNKGNLLPEYYEAFKDRDYVGRAIWSAIGAIIYLGLATAFIYIGVTHGGAGYALAGAGVVITFFGMRALGETWRLVKKAWERHMENVEASREQPSINREIFLQEEQGFTFFAPIEK